MKTIDRTTALEHFKKYNTDDFHMKHALTVEGCMRYFAEKMGYSDEADFWATVGLLHDIDFGLYADQHCQKAPDLLKEIDASDEFIRAVVSHGYGICTDVEPVHEMEKILYAIDELTGLIWATALMRPSKSVQDTEVSSVKKKFKDKKFAAGCSRDVIIRGAEGLDWELDTLIEETILAMRASETNG